jgi:hypothetical protein
LERIQRQNNQLVDAMMVAIKRQNKSKISTLTFGFLGSTSPFVIVGFISEETSFGVQGRVVSSGVDSMPQGQILSIKIIAKLHNNLDWFY